MQQVHFKYEYLHKRRFKSSGLLEKSRYKYFDWLLEDPKDDPFVTFRFHYRSWDSLEALQLVPEMCNHELLPAFSIKNSFSTPNLSGANPTLTSSGVISRFNKATANNGPEHRNRSRSPGASLPNKKIENTIFGQMVAEDTALSRVRSNQANEPDANKPKKKYQIPISIFSTSNKEKWKSQENLQLDVRPLPEPPAGQSHCRQSSASSMAFSIAPSLRSWADGDRSESPGPVLCVAAEVQVLHSRQLNQYGRKKSIFDDDDTTSSASDHNNAYSDIDQSFQFSLSAPPVYPKNNMSPVKRSPVKKPTARGLPLSTSAIFPPPAMRRDRMRHIRFKDQKRGSNSPTEGYEADHEGRNSYRRSGHPSSSGLPANMKLSQVPPRLLAVNSGFSFEFNNPCDIEGDGEGNEDSLTIKGRKSEERSGEAPGNQNREKK